MQMPLHSLRLPRPPCAHSQVPARPLPPAPRVLRLRNEVTVANWPSGGRGGCRSACAGLSPLKEFLQNADDAGAREFTLVLDEGVHAAGRLPGATAAVMQGPALLVHNSASFSERDFVSISHVGQSGKRADSSRIGKCCPWAPAPTGARQCTPLMAAFELYV